MAILKIISPPLPKTGPKEYPLKSKGVTVIGSQKRCEIVFQIPYIVSRQHAAILDYSGNHYLFDVSKNGTYYPVKDGKLIMHRSPRLPSALESDFFNQRFLERYGLMQTEKAFYQVQEGWFSVKELKRWYFINELLYDEHLLQSLLDELSPTVLRHEECLGIPPYFVLRYFETEK